MVLAGTVFVQALMVRALATDPEDGSLPLTPLRVITILGLVSAQVSLVCVWRLVAMVRRGTVFSRAAFRYVDGADSVADEGQRSVSPAARRTSVHCAVGRPSSKRRGPQPRETGKIASAGRSTISAASSALITLTLESTRTSPPFVAFGSPATSAAGLSTILVRSQGAWPRGEERTTLSVSTSHLAKPSSRGSAEPVSAGPRLSSTWAVKAGRPSGSSAR